RQPDNAGGRPRGGCRAGRVKGILHVPARGGDSVLDTTGGTLKELPRHAPRVRDAVAPQWLVEIVRPKRVPPPWPLMVRAALAICVPMAAGLAGDRPSLGLLPAI